MGQYDIAFKHLAARWPLDMARLALDREDLVVAAIAGDVPAQRREVDFAARVRAADEEFILHLECEHRSTLATSQRLLEYHVALVAREGLPVYSALLLLGEAKGPEREQIEHRLVAAGHPSVIFRYSVIRLAAHRASALIAGSGPALWAFAPLARGGARPAALRRAAARVENSGLSAAEQADIMASMAVFAGMHVKQDLVYSLLWSDKMKESTVYQHILREGETRGEARGEARGRARDILRILTKRLGPPPAGLAERLLAMDDPSRLDALLDLSLQADRFEDFTRAL